MSNRKELRVAIIGAGASGLITARELRETGIEDVTIYEKADRLGGTWRENTYPGIRCDVPSHAYRFSFAPNPEWVSRCSTGADILKYLDKCADDLELLPLIEFDQEVVSATYTNGTWHLVTTKGDQGKFDLVITASGVLHHPVYPEIPGQDNYTGAAFHSAKWDHSFDYANKRVGIIGTGSTATQIFSALIDSAASVKLFQRTAQWIMPLNNRPISEEERQTFRDDPQKLQDTFLSLIQRFNQNFSASIVGENEDGYETLVRMCEEFLATVKDDELRRKLTPDYKVGCKRLVASDEFYDAIQRDNAELVTEPIEAFYEGGLKTEDGELHELDLIVMATGFNTHQFFRPMEVTGLGSVTIEEAWNEMNSGYLTVATPGFPNWFMIGGPSSPIGNFSWLMTAETQARYICQIAKEMSEKRLLQIVPSQAAADRFNESVKARIPSTIWASGCNSWYIDKNGNVGSWPWTFEKFEEDLKTPNWDDFEIVSETAVLAESGDVQ